MILDLVVPHNAFAWYPEGGWWWVRSPYYHQPGPGAYENGYSAGIADAVYDQIMIII
jgi:hypothetical protein